MNTKIEKILNEQINLELYSAYLYMSMSAHLKALKLLGFAHWLEIQAKEEIGHALKIYYYLSSRQGTVIFEEIEKPSQSWNSPAEIFKIAYEHEKLVTERINTIVDLSISEKDFTTVSHMQWFLNEQIEEEANELAIYRKLISTNNSTEALMMVDRELALRVFVDPNISTVRSNP